MEKKNDNMLARIEFVVDKMVVKMKKCLEKKKDGFYRVLQNPAIEIQTGLMVASDSRILVAHKLQDYCFSPADNVMLSDMVSLPKEVLQMRGRVAVTMRAENGIVVTATDEYGHQATLKQEGKFPRWRTVVPREGFCIDVEAKEWDAVLKGLLSQMSKAESLYPVRLYVKDNSNALMFKYNNPSTNKDVSRSIGIRTVPFRISVMMATKSMRDVMAFQPKVMRFVATRRAVTFYNDDTLCLLMPLWHDNNDCIVENRYLEDFDLERWIGADLGEVVVDNTEPIAVKTKPTPTMEDRLREALKRQFMQAA